MELDELWVEKYRPKELLEVIMDAPPRQIFENYLKIGSFPHLLLYGRAGTGKTTIARIISSKLNCDLLEKNASDERGIETIRVDISNFVKAKTLRDFRVVLLEEADGLTPGAQQTLRNLMEKYHKNARFILTANYANKIIDPIRSRCTQIEFSRLPKDQMKARLKDILQKEGIKTTDKLDVELEEILRFCFFDMRKAINLLQKCSQTGTFLLEKATEDYSKIEELIRTKNISELKNFLATNDVDYLKLYRYLFEKLDRPQQLVTLAKYYFWMSQCADAEICTMGLAMEL
jgi:replication factor C small subunit